MKLESKHYNIQLTLMGVLNIQKNISKIECHCQFTVTFQNVQLQMIQAF